MDVWIKIWTFFFFASLAIFAILMVVVSIGGFFDIKSLFKSLNAEAEQLKQQAEKEKNTKNLND